MNKNKILLGLVGLMVVVVIAVLVGYNTGSNTIKIGALYPLTGGLAQYGELSQKTAQIAIDEINDNGGINGKKLEIVFGNHKCDPKEMVTLFNKMKDVDNVKIVTSSACTGTVTAVAPMLEKSDMVMLSTILSGRAATNISPNFFRNYASDANEAKQFADEIIKAGYKKVGVINEDTDYAKGLRLELEKNLANTDVKIVSESFSTGATDVRSQITKIRSFSPEVVFISPQTVTGGEVILAQMEDLGYYPKHLFVNDNVIKSKDLVTKHPKIMEGAIGGDYIIANNQAINEILAKYKAKYGQDCPQPNLCATVYDSINLLAKAIKESGNNSDKVQAYLKKVNYQGITGDISFDSNNDRQNANYALLTIKNGVMVQK